MEPREDSVLPQAVSMTILLSVLAFYCWSCGQMDNTARPTYLQFRWRKIINTLCPYPAQNPLYLLYLIKPDVTP